jgi:hypothetical protein
MRRWLLLVLCGLSGCLYVGELNHAPDLLDAGKKGVNITLPPEEETLKRCGKVTLTSSEVADPDGDELSYSWTVTVASDEDHAETAYALLKPAGFDSKDVCLRGTATGMTGAAAGVTAPSLGSSPALDLTVLPLRGSYAVDLRVMDVHGAARVFSGQFTVPNQPPSFTEILIGADPDFAADGVRGLIGGSETFPAHAHYWAQLLAPDDWEHDIVCDRRASVTWELLQPARSALEYWDVPPCKQEQPQDATLRFRLRRDAVTAPTTLQIRATLDDGHGGKASKEISQPIAPNRPPCIDLTVPPFDAPSDPLPTVYVSYDQGRRFDAAHTINDVPEALTYTWLVREPGGAFTAIPGQSGPVFDMPGWFRTPGQALELRAVVEEGNAGPPSCSEDDRLCPPEGTAAAKVLPDKCYQWITWSVEFI